MISFEPSTHTYFNSGHEIIPSVSKLIQFEFPGMYDGVPQAILKNKASYGTKVHETIEQMEDGTLARLPRGLDPNVKIAVQQYFSLKKKYKFKVKSMEQIVSYQERYAGTYDILTDKDFLIDMTKRIDNLA